MQVALAKGWTMATAARLVNSACDSASDDIADSDHACGERCRLVHG